MVSLFPRLHMEQLVTKFSISDFPPFDTGVIWWMCKETSGSFLGLAPHGLQLDWGHAKSLFHLLDRSICSVVLRC